MLAVGIPLVIVGGGLLALHVYFSVVISPNSAEDTVTPIARSLTAVGGKEICDNGDGGHTGLNNQPWYGVYYLVPDQARARSALFKAAAAAGYPLRRQKLFPGAAEPYAYGSSSSGNYGLYLTIIQHRVFFPGDCGDNPDKKTRISGSQAVFDITFYGRALK